MAVRFLEDLFGVAITHNFYKDKVSDDLIIQPTSETQKLISGHRLRLKNRPDGFVTIFEAIDENKTPIIPIANDLTFTFSVKVDNSSFLNFTSLVQKSKDEVYYYNNLFMAPIDGLGPEQVLKLKSTVFNHEFQSLNSTAEVKILDPISNEIFSKTLTSIKPVGSEFLFQEQINLTGFRAGRYKIQHFDVAETIPFFEEDIYLSDELSGSRALGVIEIDSSSLNPATPVTYNLDFPLKFLQWKYLVAVTGDTTGFEFAIEDTEGIPAEVTIFTDNFDDGNITTPAWTSEGGLSFFGTEVGSLIAGSTATGPGHRMKFGDRGADGVPDRKKGSLTVGLDSTNHYVIKVSFDWNRDFKGDNKAFAEYSVDAGNSWLPIDDDPERDTKGVTSVVDFALSALADDNAFVQIRFRGDNLGGGDHIFVDNIVVKGILTSVVPLPYSDISFSDGVAVPPLGLPQELKDKQVLLFETGTDPGTGFVPQTIPYYIEPKRHLELKKYELDGLGARILPGEILIKDLPNPSPNNVKPEVFVIV